MDDSQDEMRQADGSEVEEQNEGLGIDPIAAEASKDAEAQGSAVKDDDPYGIKKRLGMQAKRHQRELRTMQDQMMRMQAQMGQGANSQDYQSQQQSNPYSSPGQPNPPSDHEEDRIRKAVRYALDAKDAETRKAKEAESHAHVQKQYQRLQDEFDKASDKYEDFDDIVRANDVPFTPAIRDALLLIDNPAEVVYKLGKNRQELSRISELHPLEQAREVNKLSFALMGGNGNKSSASRANPLNAVKANPSTSNAQLSPSAIRAKLKAGTWK
jgi:hypothetical protein